MGTEHRIRIAACLTTWLGMATVVGASPATLWPVGDDRQGTAAALDEVAVFVGQASLDVETDEATTAWVRGRLREMFALNLYRVYASMTGPDGDRRWVGAVAEPTSTGLRVQRALSPMGSQGRPIGVSTIELGLAPQAKVPGAGTPYTVEQRFGMAMGPLTPSVLMNLASRVIDTLEADAGEDVIRRTMPRAADRVESVVRLELSRNQGPEGVRHLVVEGTVEPELLRTTGYPDLAMAVRRWGDLGCFDAEIRDVHGHRLFKMEVDTDPATLRLSWSSENGRIIPLDGAGVPIRSEAWDLARENMVASIHGELDAQFEGFHLEIDRWVMPMTWRADVRTWAMVVSVETAPRITLVGEGALRQVILDIADSTMRLTHHGREVAESIATGLHGDGTRFHVGLNQAPPSGWWLEQRLDTRLVDNGVVRFAFRLLAGRLVPSEAGFSDAARLVASVMEAGLADYEAARPMLVTQ